jgi:lipopolysaccharide export LptBFGC system permease protein LptF
MKRFSWLTFIGVTLVHIYITGELINASIRATKLVNPEPWSVWLTVWSWIFQPILMLFLIFLRAVGVHPDNSYRLAIALVWSICLGVFFGFLVPRLLRLRHQIA